MKVMMDIDGVWADFVLEFTRMAKLLFPNEFTRTFGVRGAKEWGFKNVLTKTQIDLVWLEIRKGTFFWEGIPTLFTEADRDAIRRIAEKHDLQWVTSRSGNDALGQTKRWLQRHGLPNWQTAVLAGESKGEFVKTNGTFDVALDDAPTQIGRLREAGQFVVVMDTPYNRDVGGRRVNSICEFEMFLDELEVFQTN